MQATRRPRLSSPSGWRAGREGPPAGRGAGPPSRRGARGGGGVGGVGRGHEGESAGGGGGDGALRRLGVAVAGELDPGEVGTDLADARQLLAWRAARQEDVRGDAEPGAAVGDALRVV